MDVERPLHARVSGRDAEGEPIEIEASGLEARVLQHEIDHLDGVLILDRTSRDQRKGALRALRERRQLQPPPATDEPERRGRASRAAHRRVSTVYLGTSDFAATVLRPLAGSAHKPDAGGHATRPPPGPRPQAVAAARRRWPREELGIELLQAEDVNEESVRERIARRRSRRRRRLRLRPVDPRAAALRAPDAERPPSLLPRWRGAAPIERAIMAGDRRTGVCVMKLTAGLDAGPVALSAEVADRRRHRLRGALRDPRRDRRQAAGAGARRSRPRAALEFVEQDEAAVTYAEKIDPAERRLDPARPAAELAATVRALTPHIGAYLETADGERLGVRRARAVDVSVKTGAVKSEWGALLVGCSRGALRSGRGAAGGRQADAGRRLPARPPAAEAGLSAEAHG